MHGLILFSHGARDPRWAEPFERTLARVRELAPKQPVALAFLEFMQPNLADCARELVRQGCERIEVLPLFLGAGGHVRKDLPVMMEQLAQEFPAVAWRLRPTAGESDILIDALARIALAEVGT